MTAVTRLFLLSPLFFLGLKKIELAIEENLFHLKTEENRKLLNNNKFKVLRTVVASRGIVALIIGASN